MQSPTSAPEAESACRSRAAYGAPDAPVIPRKTFTGPAGSLSAAALALRLGEEGAEKPEVLLAEVRERRHDGVPEVGRVGNVGGEAGGSPRRGSRTTA